MTDDLGFGDVSCYNPESRVQTPHLDALAAQGMRFTNAHSPATVCTPTRFSLMTGTLCFRIGRSPVFTGLGGPCLIQDKRITLPELLRDKGYATGMYGKWHIGMTFYDEQGEPIHKGGLDGVKRIDYSRRIDGGPLDHGLDAFYGTVSCPTTDWLYAYIENDRIVAWRRPGGHNPRPAAHVDGPIDDLRSDPGCDGGSRQSPRQRPRQLRHAARADR